MASPSHVAHPRIFLSGGAHRVLKTSTNRTRPLVYNRVPKAASTSMIVVLQRLARRNHFGVTSAPAMQYWPRLTELRARLESLRPDHCYINHCSTLDDSRRQWLWINIVRKPLAHYKSLHYWERRGLRERARLQKRDPVCGCAHLELAPCLSVRLQRKCPIRLWQQRNLFCVPDASWAAHENGPPPCSVEEALQIVQQQYLLVGLAEEFDVTLRALEALLPRYFAGASQMLADGPIAANVGSSKAATRSAAKNLTRQYIEHVLVHNATNYAGERLFYEGVRRVFREKLAEASLHSRAFLS